MYVQHPIVSVPHGEMRSRAEPAITAIVEIATETGANAAASLRSGAGATRPAAAAVLARITVEDDPEAIFERFASEGWTDGLPIVAPTEARVAQMLTFSDLDPSSSLGPMPPRWGETTIATVAVNAVMAGCRPEYFPVIVTAVKAILAKPFNLYGVQGTTNPASPVLIVNGPIARELGINARGNLFGPGFRANATIGRAIRLIMTTIGGGVPQQADKSTLGNPAKYTCCFAESEADSPWAPLHVERGFQASTSTVTAFGGAAPANIIEKSKTVDEMLETIARAVAVSGSNNMFMSQEALVVLGPEHAAIAARQGFDKKRVRQALFERARISFEQIGQSNADVLAVWRGNCIDTVDGRRALRVVEKPDDIVIVVAGGAGNHSASIPGWYSRSVTLPITRADGAPIRAVGELQATEAV
ncbi:MAG: hypothetical protein DMD87_27140 [Candidatus Rokuibacteriota bacterium]|nr:MAG: hypothetical protein DMD87_27140 [Candidatus Rokubacteria bacterium]